MINFHGRNLVQTVAKRVGCKVDILPVEFTCSEANEKLFPKKKKTIPCLKKSTFNWFNPEPIRLSKPMEFHTRLRHRLTNVRSFLLQKKCCGNFGFDV